MQATQGVVGAGENYGNRASENVIGAERYAGDVGMQGAATAGGFRYGGEEAAGRFNTWGTQATIDAIMGQANAQAAGKVGAANAWNSALGGVGSAASTAASNWTLRAIFKPEVTPNPPKKQ